MIEKLNRGLRGILKALDVCRYLCERNEVMLVRNLVE